MQHPLKTGRVAALQGEGENATRKSLADVGAADHVDLGRSIWARRGHGLDSASQGAFQ